MNKHLIDQKSEYALGNRTPAVDSVAMTVPSTIYHDGLNSRVENLYAMPTCFGKATLDTLKISSPYPTLGE